MNIYGSLPTIIDRVASSTGNLSHTPAGEAKPSVAQRHAGDVEAARSTALSALKNDRFGTMLAKIFEPEASGALMTMTRDAGSAGADFNSVLASYAENGE